MKKFAEVRRPLPVLKVGNTKISFREVETGVEVYVDGALLDVYADRDQAEKFANEFKKQLEGLQ